MAMSWRLTCLVVTAAFGVGCDQQTSPTVLKGAQPSVIAQQPLAPLPANWSGPAAIATVVQAQALTTVDFGSSPAGPITNTEGAAGDFAGTEYSSLGLLFDAAPGHTLNIGCGRGTGSALNCLGASVGLGDDFAGTVIATFKLGGVDQVTDQVVIPYANPTPPPTRTIIRDASGGILLDQAAGDVNFSAPGIASVEMRFTFDGAESFSFGNLSPQSCQATVQRLSQGDPAWANNTYDSSNQSIKQLGCALTSLSMALSFAGVVTDPGSLNTFMTQTDNDFVGTAVNWPATVRDRSGSTLRYQALTSSTPQQLQSALCAGFPVIAGVSLSGGVPGHFVLVTGKSGNRFLIADPGFASRTTLDDYQNQFSIRGVVVPAGFAGPLSAGMLNPGFVLATGSAPAELDLAIEEADLLLIDSFGRRTGFVAGTNQILQEIPGSAYSRDALDDDVTGIPATHYSALTQVVSPPAGAFTLVISGIASGVHMLSIRGFSTDGGAHPAIVSPVATVAGSISTFTLTFAPEPSGQTTLERQATFATAIADVLAMRSAGAIDDPALGASITRKLRAGAEAAARGLPLTSLNILRALAAEISAQTGVHITPLGAQVLSEDIAYLRKRLGVP